MKGYVYLDNDHNLNIREKQFIDEIDPGFWGRNAVWVKVVWEFDSEKEETIVPILTSLRKYELKIEIVNNFCKTIGFDLQGFLAKKKQQ